MTQTAADRAPRRRAPLYIAAGIILALIVVFFLFAGLLADIFWYDQLGFLPVLTTQWIAAVVLFVIGFLAMAVPVWLSITLAYRLRPVYAKLNSQLDRYQQVVEPLRRLAMIGIPIVLGLFAGVAAATRWQSVLMWLNRTPTGQTDPQFGFDLAFFLFDRPFFHGVVGFASAVVMLAGLAGIATSYLYGALRITGREVRISKSARIQIAVTAALYLLLQGISIWLDQYSALTDETDYFMNGAMYTGVNAVIPGRAILAGIAIVVAALFLVTAFIARWRIPIVGTALLIVSALLVGSVYPWVVQRFQVDPNQRQLDSPYIQRGIDLTKEAYGVDEVEEVPYNATTDAAPGALREDAETTANIRILDPSLVSPSFAQLEQYRQYYAFPSLLDVDRYVIDGTRQDTVLAVRELNQSGLGDAQNWVNDTIVYTHGYGVVAAYGNQRSVDGAPVFLEQGIPVTGNLGEYEPRIYFGENSPQYSIVGAPEGADPVELDYPSNEDGEGNTRTTFSEDGGPKLDNIFKRLIYALKFQSEQIFLSDSVNEESQILYDRDPVQRVQKVAPYLTLDSDAYPAVVDGRIKWIVDGYTTSANYPYSKLVSLSEAIADSETPPQPYALDNVNYIRNSVKATVDAYDGTVDLFAWDADDPLLQTWQKIFPATVQPMEEMTVELMSHVRYPEDLFKVQRYILGQYHVSDAGSFFSRDDAWQTPNDPVSTAGQAAALQPPYYLTMQVPGAEAPAFTLYSTFIPQAAGESSRNVLTGYLTATADAGTEPGEISEDYGKLRLLALPKDVTVPGPGQVQNAFDSDPVVSQQLNLLRQGQTDVLPGNLLTVPVGGGLLYVQPVYVRSTGGTSYPLLQKVLVAFGDEIAFEDTLDGALDELFGGDSGATAGDTDVDTAPTIPGGTETPDSGAPPEDGVEPGTGGGTGAGTSTNPELQAALDDANEALQDKQTALQAGDWTAYGEADARLADAIERALAASQD